MKRTALVAAAVTTLLIALPALAARASAASTDTALDTLSGIVLETVRESPGDPHAAEDDERHLVLATDTSIVPLSEGGPQLTSGDHVEVEVVRDGDTVEVVDVLTSYGEAAVSDPAAIDREVYVAIVSPAGYTRDQNTNTAASVRRYVERASAYWSSQTAGIIDFSYQGSLAPYVSDHACGDTERMWTEAATRFADAGIDVTGVGKYLIVVGPTGSWEHADCDYGLGTLGALDAARNAVFVSDVSQSLYAHELGHNLGLAHANALRCNGDQDGAWDGAGFGSNCQRWRYEDLLDVMGYSGETYGEGNLNVAHLDDLDLDPTAIRTVAGPSTVTVPPLSSTTAAGRGLRVRDTTGVTYYVEYRTATGLDAVAGANPYRPTLGVLLYREDPDAYRNRGSYHLDATPHRSDDFDYDRALRPGATFTSAAGTLTITTVSQDATGAVLEIAGGAPTTEPEPPADSTATITLTGPSAVRRNGTLTLTARVRTAAGAAVPNTEVIFQRRVDSTWRTLRTTRTATTGVARATVRLRRSATFRVATTAPVTYSSRAAVRVRRT